MTTDVTDLAALRAEHVRNIATTLRDVRGPLLPILHAIQEELEYVDPADVPVIADVLNLSRAEVHGVVTFYRDFRRAPAGRTTVRVCRAEACQAVGAEALAEHAKRRRASASARPPPTARSRSTRSSASATARSVRRCRWATGCTAGSTPPASTHCWERPDDSIVCGCSSRGTPLPGRSAPTRSPSGSPLLPPPPAATSRWCATARAACSGWSRWSRSRRPRAASGTGRSRRRTSTAWSPPACSTAPTGRPRTRRGPAVDARQQRVTFARVGVIDPLSLEDYEANGGLAGLRGRARR